MKWYAVVEAIAADCLADAALVAIYGASMRKAGAGDLAAPLLEWQVIGDTEGELWAPVTIQFDQWVTNQTDLARSEIRLRQKYHRDLPDADLGGMMMWRQYVDGAELASPNRDGYFARAVRFRLSPLRDQYHHSPAP